MEGDCIFDWIKNVIEGSGGLLDYERHEWAVRNYSDEITAAIWVIKCLGNPKCEGSAEVLKAILDRRKEMGEATAI